MRNLLDFELPNEGEITLCEVNGRVHSINVDSANIGTFTNTLDKHPKIHITRDQLHAVSSGDEGKALFLPVDVSFLKRLTQVYYEQGFIEALRLAKSHNILAISKTASVALDILKYINKIRLLFNPNVRYTVQMLISQFGQTCNWQNSTLRFIAWHPYYTKLAVVTCDDSVRIYSSESNYNPLLRCRQQKNVTCVAWRPLSNNEIAVGHEEGVIIWNIDPSSLVSRPSVSNAMILKKSDHTPVISLAWSPKGDKLVTVAGCDNSILVWDPEMGTNGVLKRPGGCGNVLVKWSPTGEKLFSCSDSLVFRVWDCRSWECERWTVLSGRVQAACWCNCGTTLLFSTNNEPVIYGVIVKSDLVFTSDSESSSNQAIPIFDVSKCDLDAVVVGGIIQSMETDSTGCHLAVLFQDTHCIAIFKIVKQPNLQLIPSSLVIGLPEERPSTITFQKNFEMGACLTIGWSSGRIQYYPIVYTDLAETSVNARNISQYNTFNATLRP